MPTRARASRRRARTRTAGRSIAAALAALVSSIAATGALAATDGDAFGALSPPLETLGDTFRIREGRIGDPEALAAEAERAAAGAVSDGNALLDSLPRHASSDPVDGTGATPRSGYRYETWIADVGVLLPGDLDRDGDGFFAGFELTLDVDTELSVQDVYATIELTDAAGFVTLRHDTAVFAVYGYSSADRYRVEVELLGDHAAGYRDLSIDVRDAHDGRRLDRVSAHDFRSLASLPLEGERDGFLDDGTYHPSGGGYHGDDVHHGGAYVAGYAGAAGPLGVLATLARALGRRIRYRPPLGSGRAERSRW